MITLKIKQWVPINDIEHVSTSWQVSTSPDENNVIDSVDQSSDFLTIYYSNVTPPVGIAYYIRAKRYFNNNTDSGWSSWVPVIGKPETNTLVINIDILVERPLVFIDENEIKDNTKETFTINTSEFKSNIDGHHHTHWIILNGRDEVVYESLYDETNLTSITINKNDIKLFNMAMIKIVVIHCTATDVCSENGRISLSLSNDLFNYEIVNKDNDRVYPNSDYIVKLEKIDRYKSYGVINVKLLEAVNGNLLYEKDIDKNANRFLIPGQYLKENESYSCVITSISRDGSILTNSMLIKTIDLNERDVIDFNYKYELKSEYLYDMGSFKMSNFLVTHEWYNRNIPVIINDEFKIYVYDNVEKKLVPGDNISNVNLYSNKDNIFIKLLGNNNLVIDSVNDSGNPIFDVYEYDPYTNTVQYLHGIVRDDEDISLGKTNGLVMVSIDEAVYIPVGKSVIKKVNFTTKEITTLTNIPMNNLGNATLLNTHEGRVVVIGGSDDLTKIYYIKENLWLDGLRTPIPFRDSDLQKVDLNNGDSVIFKTNYVDNNNFLHYDISEGTLKEIVNPLSNNAEPDSLIKLKTGNVLRKVSDPDSETDKIIVMY